VNYRYPIILQAVSTVEKPLFYRAPATSQKKNMRLSYPSVYEMQNSTTNTGTLPVFAWRCWLPQSCSASLFAGNVVDTENGADPNLYPNPKESETFFWIRIQIKIRIRTRIRIQILHFNSTAWQIIHLNEKKHMFSLLTKFSLC
jgi:hypothetical protein